MYRTVLASNRITLHANQSIPYVCAFPLQVACRVDVPFLFPLRFWFLNHLGLCNWWVSNVLLPVTFLSS